MKPVERVFGKTTALMAAGGFMLGLLFLGVRLKEVQVDDAARYADASKRQSVWRVRTPGIRGRILDRHGSVLADNRPALSLVCGLWHFQRRSWSDTIVDIERAADAVGKLLGRKSTLTLERIRRHVQHRERALPLVVFSRLTEDELAVFSEHAASFPGFAVEETDERFYPEGKLAAHTLGYVGIAAVPPVDSSANYRLVLPETVGKSGLEAYYDGYLRGVAGERQLLVDARCLTLREWTTLAAKSGPDLQLTLDLALQREVERQLAGVVGACAVIDPRNGEVLAVASAPGYDLNACVPCLSAEYYDRLCSDAAKPLLNRVMGGTYAPGSTFKPITSLAALKAGYPEDDNYCCGGSFAYGAMTLKCTARWGHGDLDLRRALMKSCNSYFCNLGVAVGTNAIVSAAHAFGLGEKTGIDFLLDARGVVPDARWKAEHYHEKWFMGDLIQMAIGQGMLLVTPLQMACVAGALGTGLRVTPHLKKDLSPECSPLPFDERELQVVREGMRMVVAGHGSERGTGWRGGEGVAVTVAGKTGTAEVGVGTRRRNNTWFIAYAPAEKPSLAVAMVVENGASGGSTTAPRVAEILKVAFNDR